MVEHIQPSQILGGFQTITTTGLTPATWPNTHFLPPTGSPSYLFARFSTHLFIRTPIYTPHPPTYPPVQVPALDNEAPIISETSGSKRINIVAICCQMCVWGAGGRLFRMLGMSISRKNSVTACFLFVVLCPGRLKSVLLTELLLKAASMFVLWKFRWNDVQCCLFAVNQMCFFSRFYSC